MILFFGGEPAVNLLMLPTEILGLQTVFGSSSGVRHNGGTWFISCFVICYLLFPYIFEIMHVLKLKSRIFITIGLGLFLLYAPFVVIFTDATSIYINSFFRFSEFTVGALLCSIWFDVQDKNYYRRYLANWRNVIISLVFFFIVVSIARYLGIYIQDYMLYNWIALPMFTFIILCLAGVQNDMLEKSQVLLYLTEIGYSFFFAQLFAWDISKAILSKIGIDSVLSKLMVGTIVCLLISILLHELIEKPVKELLKRKLLI